MSDLGSAPVPDLSDEDHVRGPEGGGEPVGAAVAAPGAAVLIEYADFECPYCAALHERLAGVSLTRAFRHFPVRSSHPRAWPAACAAEAAALQGRFWEMHDSLYGDQARLEDPHLWERAEHLGLDVDRFDTDRRSDAVLRRVRRDFESGVRAGVVTTPTVFFEGEPHTGDAILRLIQRFAGG